MTSPSHSAAGDLHQGPQRSVRRSRKAIQLSVSLVVVAALAFSTTACTPEITAKDAIAKYWAHNSACAERVVARESRFQADAVNRTSGATGLFQMMPLHRTWIRAELGYSWSDMTDPYKNSKAAKRLSAKNYAAYGDGWAPWRLSGRAIRGGGCPA